MSLPNSEQLEQMRQVLERIERRQDDTQERMQRYDQMGEEIASIEVSASSPDRSITVTAGPGGSVKSVELRPEAMRMSHQTLGRTITATIQRAVADAAKRQAAVVQEFAGDRLDIVGRVYKTQEQIFGQPEEPEQGTGSRSANVQRRQSTRWQDDDYDDEEGFGPILER